MGIWYTPSARTRACELPGTVPLDPVLIFQNNTAPYSDTVGFDVLKGNSLTLRPGGRITSNGPETHFKQTVTLSAAQQVSVNSGKIRVNATFNMAAATVPDKDEGNVGIVFKDALGEPLGMIGDFTREYSDDEVLGEDVLVSGRIPIGTATLDFTWIQLLRDGTELSVYTGSFTGYLEEEALLAMHNVFLNAGTAASNFGYSDDVVDWTITSGSPYVLEQNVPAIFNMIGGSNTDLGAGNRVIVFDAAALALVATGGAQMLLSIYLCNWNRLDTIKVTLEALDALDVVLDTIVTDAVLINPKSCGQNFEIASPSTLPTSATKFRISYSSDRLSGTTNDAGFGFLSLNLLHEA